MSAYAELHCLSNFSFLRGASHPHELVETAKQRGYTALAITDECSLAGIVRAHQAAKEHGLKLLVGTELRVSTAGAPQGRKIVLLVPDAIAYAALCRLITRARRRAPKGEYDLQLPDLQEVACTNTMLLLLPDSPVMSIEEGAKAYRPGPIRRGRKPDERPISDWHALVQLFPQRCWLGIALHRSPDDAQHLQRLQALAQELGIPAVACGDVHMHVRARRCLQDTLTAIRHGCTLDAAGDRLFPNGERHLRSLKALRALYPPELLAETIRIAERCTFSLDSLRYRYPAEDIPAGSDANTHLRYLTQQGLKQRYPKGIPATVQRLVDKELNLIAQLDYPHYFLTVQGIMQWARKQNILCQGRGSAANSAVCFALGITVVNPARSATLFERFVSAERREPPDIDVDFEHHRREEVFQHIYRKYGRHRAALAATVIRYRTKSALRDVGKALGLSLAQIDRLIGTLAWWDQPDTLDERLREAGLEPDSPRIRLLRERVDEVRGFPRHLSQHVGGFVISDVPLDGLVPIENAAMAERTVIQWDKDDLDAVGLFKVDCLALGMLTAIHRAFDSVAAYSGRQLSIPGILAGEEQGSADSRAVFDMLCEAESEGVFQVESRAQMSMLPRMRPRNLYDLTIETAIVRPGPIQGGMVHPYLNRRMGREPTTYPPALKSVLERTHGIPIFQEQVMEVCVKGAGFAPGEADQVRRSMAAWGRSGYGKLERFEKRLKEGMTARGYSSEFAEQVFGQIKGFAEYGFPESHAASFAVLVYVSAWLKRFEPAAFLVGLLNSQPMGFYSPSQLVQVFQRQHQVKVRPPDVLFSDWDSTLECRSHPPKSIPAVRLGLNRIKGLSEEGGRRVMVWKQQWRTAANAVAVAKPLLPAPDALQELFSSCRLDARDREALAAADALRSLTGSRYRAAWAAQGASISVRDTDAQASQGPHIAEADEETARLDEPSEGAEIISDYQRLGLTLRRHPLALLRSRLRQLRTMTAAQWRCLANGQHCRVAGLVTNRQRPGTAQGIIFMTIEDETGSANLVIRPPVLEAYRPTVLQAGLVIAEGRNEYRDGVRHLLVEKMENHAALMGRLTVASRDFH